MAEEAAANGFDPTLVESLRELCLEFEDIFRIDLDNDPPADSESLLVTVRPDATPFRVSQRRYPPDQLEFL